jgi:hypothetical protein
VPSCEMICIVSESFPSQNDFLTCPSCGSGRLLILRGESNCCFINNTPCIDWRVGKHSLFIIFKCEKHCVLVCLRNCPRLGM